MIETIPSSTNYKPNWNISIWNQLNYLNSFNGNKTIRIKLKPLYTFGKQCCPSPTLRVSQLLYKITNLWKFRLNRSSVSGENNWKTHSCFRTFCRVMTCVFNKSVILAIENWYCFNVFSKSKAFIMEQYFKRSLSPLPSVNHVNYW